MISRVSTLSVHERKKGKEAKHRQVCKVEKQKGNNKKGEKKTTVHIIMHVSVGLTRIERIMVQMVVSVEK